jgi:anti-anti-sigma factor
MNYTIRDEDGVREVDLIGQLTFDATDSFREVIDSLDKDKVKACVLDMASLDFIDSAGLGLLVLAHASAGRAGIPLSMRHPRGQVREMIEVAEFHTIIPCEF